MSGDRWFLAIDRVSAFGFIEIQPYRIELETSLSRMVDYLSPSLANRGQRESSTQMVGWSGIFASTVSYVTVFRWQGVLEDHAEDFDGERVYRGVIINSIAEDRENGGNSSL